MNLYLLFIVILSLIGIKIFIKDFNKNYMSKESTSCIKGIFILIVFYSHLVTYTVIQKSKDFMMLNLRNFLGQLMVTMFLFYSGYGIYESIKRKKQDYVKSIPVKRILITLFNFDIAVLSFVIINQFLGRVYSLKNILLSFVGWEGIGNSNWYIFGILFMYLITYISFTFFDKDNKKALVSCWLLTLLFVLFMSVHKEDYWFNTLFCYPLGLTYSYYKDKIEKKLFNNKKYLMALGVSLIAFLVFRELIPIDWIYYQCMSIFFCIVLILITMKVNIHNRILKWLGDNLFWLYILQRIPMLILTKIGYSIHAYRFTFICFCITVFMSFIYSFVFNIINKKILDLLKIEKKI